MDNVTHAALGFAIAEAAFPSLGRSGLALAVVASELPDIDIFFGLGNPWSMVTTHRAITHSIFVAPLAAAALAGVWAWLSGAGGFRAFFALALVCLLGHIFLDVLTTYGTQILEPFSKRRFGWGWVAVIDPVVTAALLAGGLIAWWIRGHNPAAANRAALAGLLVAAGYVGLGAWQYARAMGVLGRQTASLGRPLAADATPQIGTIFLWRLLYRNDNTFWVARYNSLTGRLAEARALPAGLDPSLAPLLEVPRAKVFRDFAGGLIRPHVDPDDSNVLVLEDMRFSWPTASPVGLWALRMEFERNGQAVPEVRQVEFVQRRMRLGGGRPIRERVRPPTGEPCAGDPPARFGRGRDRVYNRFFLPLYPASPNDGYAGASGQDIPVAKKANGIVQQPQWQRLTSRHDGNGTREDANVERNRGHGGRLQDVCGAEDREILTDANASNSPQTVP